MTQGYLVGEVVRRVTGRTLGTFYAEEIAGPLGADFWIGTPPEVDGRIAPTIPSETGPELPQEGSLAYRASTNAARPRGVRERRRAAGRDPPGTASATHDRWP